MPKGTTLFSYFSPKPAAKKADDVLTPKRSPNDGKSKSSPGKKDKETAAQSPVTPKAAKPKQNGSTPASASASSVKKGSAVKKESVWAVGDLVWGKLEGYPWWPGMVTHHPTSGSHFMKGKKPSVHVQFFDDPPSRAWIKEMFIEEFSGSHVLDFQKGGRYWTKDMECHKGAQLADTALGLNSEDRIEKYHQVLPSTDESEDDEEEDMEDDSKENLESKVIEKTPSKSPRAKGRLPSRQATKRRRIILEDHASDSDEFKPPKSNAGSDDSASSGVAESDGSSGSGSDSESYSELENDSPVKATRKRKRGSTSTKSKNDSTSDAKGPRIKRRMEADSEEEEEEPLPEVRSSPWAQTADDDKPKSLLSTPTVTAKTKSRLSSFAAPDTPSAPAAEAERSFTHTTLEFLKPDKIKDAQKRSPDHPDYDKRTLLLPPGFLDKQTPAHRQWWDLKAKHFDTVFFFKVGKFYEMFHMDAAIAVRELGMIYMKGEYAHSGFPEIAYGRYADTLIQRGYKVARIEQTETPDNNAERCKKMLKATKFDKVVRREVCRVTTKGTRVYSFIDGDTSEAQAAFLLAIAEKEPIEGAGVGSTYGVCFVDTSIGEFHIGQFEDDRHCSRLRTLISHFTPVEVLHERGKISEKTKTLLNNNLSNVLREALHPGSEFWESSKTLKVLSETEYFVDEKDTAAGAQWPDVLTKMKADSDPLGHTAAEDFDLAVRSLGALTWYLRGCCLDQELLSMRKFTEYLPIDQNSREGAPRKATGTSDVFTARQHMVLDGVTLANLDVVENSSTGGLDGTLLQRIDSCVTPFGKRLLKQWLVSPLCQPASINDRLDAVEDLMEAQDAVAMATELLKKIPDLERLLSKIHTLGSANRSKDHPDGRAVFFEDLTYSKRKIEDLLSALSGFTAAKDVVGTFKAIAKKFKSKLLRQTTLLEADGGRFPDLAEQLEFFAKAFDQQKAKTQGTITPNKGVDPEFDEAIVDIKKIKNELDEYLEEQRDFLKCRTVAYFGTAKNRFQLEVPDSASKKVPDSYEVTSSRKGFRRYWTDEIKDLLARMLDAEERRDAALRDCLRRIFFTFDKSHAAWLAGVQCLAVLDVLICLSQFSRCGDGVMCRPEIITPSHDTTPILEIREGRHPCIARTFSGGDFIPNDTVIGISDDAQDSGEAAASQVVLVTGPNMGGKSTLMRQVGVIITLAQLGCYAPAEVCRLTPVDRIFTRLGASDRIMAGESTFFVELSETSAILQHATKHSLVLLDELGRGTATYDGTAIACAVVQEVSQNIGCRTLFSTHYHSLVEEFSHDPNIRLGHMACMVENENCEDPSQETITFLYKFIGGACPKSYGFNAARLADIPEEIIKVATKKAKEFENTTNRIEWFRELHKLDESKIAQIQALHEEIVVN